MKEFNNKVYRLLTYELKDIFFYFLRAFILLSAYTGWVWFRSDLRRGIIAAAVWVLLAALIFYVNKNRIVYVHPNPRQKAEKKQLEPEVEAVENPKAFVMNVDESAFGSFTFNDYVADTFKKQDSNQILDLLADRNKLLLEELKQ